MNNTNLSTLKKLAVCLGCCECTEDNPATTNAEAIEFICERIDSVVSKGVNRIALREDADGKLVSGIWEDSAGEKHTIEIRQ